MNPAYLIGSLRLTLRNPRFAIFTVILPVVLYLTVGATQRGTIDGATAASYFMVNMALYGAMAGTLTNGARIALERASGWLRQLRLTPLTSRDYVASKVAVGMTFALLSLVLVVTVAVVVTGVRLPPLTLLECITYAWVALIPFAAMGIAIGYLGTADTVQPIIAIGFNVLAILGGTWFPVSQMGPTMESIAKLTPSYWANVAGRAPITHQTVGLQGILVMAAWGLAAAAFAARRYRADLVRA